MRHHHGPVVGEKKLETIILIFSYAIRHTILLAVLRPCALSAPTVRVRELGRTPPSHKSQQPLGLLGLIPEVALVPRKEAGCPGCLSVHTYMLQINNASLWVPGMCCCYAAQVSNSHSQNWQAFELEIQRTHKVKVPGDIRLVVSLLLFQSALGWLHPYQSRPCEETLVARAKEVK